MATAVPEWQAPEAASEPKPHQRRRARRACLACHERKVRCDVLQRRPCTNCEQDRCKCIVRPHKYRRASVAALELDNQAVPDTRGDVYAGSTSVDVPETPTVDSRYVNDVHPTPDAAPSRETNDGRFGYNIPGPPSNINPWLDQQDIAPSDVSNNINFNDLGGPLSFDFDSLGDLDAIALAGIEYAFNPGPTPTNPQAYQSFAQPSPPLFLQAANSPRSTAPNVIDLFHSPKVRQSLAQSEDRATDLEYLRSQGCFQLPPAPIFHELMHAYFTFVHPHLPIIDEAEFWDLWSHEHEPSFRCGNFSILVLQAMAFAATSFTSVEVIKGCGFQSARRGRSTFSKRAKLLFDMEIENDPFCMAQGALLLTYFTSSVNQFRGNSQWLTHAIRFARIANADRSHEVARDQPRRRAALKRLWWGCILRDRVLPLGLRRPIQIRNIIPVLDPERYLTEADFSDELGASRVHTIGTQRRLIQVINLMCRLSEAVTPAMMTLYAAEKPRDRAIPKIGQVEGSIAQARSHLLQLHDWYSHAVTLFPPPICLDDEQSTVAIFANLLFIYYDAAVLAICHHAMILWETRSAPTQGNPSSFDPPVTEVINAVTDTTERVKELLQIRLAQHLPISLSDITTPSDGSTLANNTRSAYLTLPFVLYALSVKLSSTEADIAMARRQLQIYVNVMKLQRDRYDGTDEVFELLENVQKYAEEQREGLSLERDDSADGSRRRRGMESPRLAVSKHLAWRELLQRKPRMYLRLVLHVDVTLCQGVPPEEQDFPPHFRRA